MNTTVHATVPARRVSSRRWVFAALFAVAAALAVWGAWAVGSALWGEGLGLHSDFDISVNGQPWFHDGAGSLLGWLIGAAVVGVLLLVALAVLLPLALGGIALGVLLVVGLVLGAVALPVLLVLALLLSPLLALGGLAWMLLA